MEIYGGGPARAIREGRCKRWSASLSLSPARERSCMAERCEGTSVVPHMADRLICCEIAGAARCGLLRSHPDMLAWFFHLKKRRGVFLGDGHRAHGGGARDRRDVARLQLSVARHRASMVDLEEFIERDMAFHRRIALISGNPIFPSIVESLFRWAGEYYRPLVRAPGAEELTLSEHQPNRRCDRRNMMATVRLEAQCARI